MITRFAMFEGSVRPGGIDAFRSAVLERLVPLWRRFPGNSDVRVMFSEDREEGAPEFPLILAITYSDMTALETALESDVRARSRDVTGEIVAEFFEGRIHHHVMLSNHFGP